MKDEIIISDDVKLELNELLKTHSMDEIGIIYGHECVLTGLWYCGQTYHSEDPTKRWGSNGIEYINENTTPGEYSKFGTAIIENGWINFNHYILKYCLLNELNMYEKYFIKEKNSFENGYNSTTGGDCMTSFCHETREKLSKSHIGKTDSDITKKKKSLSHIRSSCYRKNKRSITEI